MPRPDSRAEGAKATRVYKLRFMTTSNIYDDGTYLRNSPSWHQEDSDWKADRIVRILSANAIRPRSIAEIGCGAGEVLRCVQTRLGMDVVCRGYDISPQAHSLASSKARSNLEYVLGDLNESESADPYDLVMAIDVFEHVEDCFGFLRRLRTRGIYKVFHIPLDLSILAILRRNGLLAVRESVGHIHYFTKETALRTLTDTGYEVLDSFYTAGSIELPNRGWRADLIRLPRLLGHRIDPDRTARFLGGFSLMVLAR